MAESAQIVEKLQMAHAGELGRAGYGSFLKPEGMIATRIGL
jgi:hypothetical protein